MMKRTAQIHMSPPLPPSSLLLPLLQSLPRVPIRKSSSPAPGGGVPQKVAQRSFSTMPKTQSYNKEDGKEGEREGGVKEGGRKV